jgi:DNA repair photolyase
MIEGTNLRKRECFECSSCYVCNTLGYLGFSAGLDLETKIMVKENTAELLRRALSSPKWKPRTLAISGVTDFYQPVGAS